MGARLAEAIRSAPGARLAVEPAGNEIFAVVTRDVDERLKATGAVYHPWAAATLAPDRRPAGNETLIRLIASFSTREEDVDRFAAALGG
jgi:threonine aldolase